MSTDKVQSIYIDDKVCDLHGTLLEIVGVMNRPQCDEAMIQTAGISLDRALFTLLVLVERFGPIGVVDLADRVGRDHTTVSRQVAKMENLGLIIRQEGSKDRRIRTATITKHGKAIADRLGHARKKIARRIFEKWNKQDIDDFVRLMHRFASDIKGDI